MVATSGGYTPWANRFLQKQEYAKSKNILYQYNETAMNILKIWQVCVRTTNNLVKVRVRDTDTGKNGMHNAFSQHCMNENGLVYYCTKNTKP